MSAVVEYQHHLPETAASIRARVNRVQEVMAAVMKQDVHYGKIPGTPKPSLWKPGAEVLCATFHIAPSFRIEDLSGADFVRYRVTCIGTHQGSGIVMGEGLGECSSLEEKYKWRKAVSTKEFEAAPEDRRRTKFGKDYTVSQVRAESADQANTILKMACKRAHVAMTLNVLAASDIFTQDIEDLPDELREQGEEKAEKKPVRKPQAKSAGAQPEQQQTQQQPAADPNAKLSEGQVRILKARLEGAAIAQDAFTKQFGVALVDLPAAKFNDASAWIREMLEANQ